MFTRHLRSTLRSNSALRGDRGCCTWRVFLIDFEHHWLRETDLGPSLIGEAPTAQQWAQARSDWLQMNTGREAVCNALARSRDECEHRADEAEFGLWVRVVSRHYVRAGSALAAALALSRPEPDADQER